MVQFHDLPDENVALIFSFLNPWESLSCRRVAKSWRTRLVGCAAFTCSFPSTNSTGGNTINGVWIKGYRYQLNDEDEVNDETRNRRRPFQWRTKGQLPEPLVLSTRAQLFNDKPFGFYAKGGTVAFRMEESGSQLVWDTADLSLSSCLVTRLAKVQPRPGAPFVLSQKRTKPLLKRVLVIADLSSVKHLKRISLRGCSNLQSLHLPSSLEALDSSSCSNLTTITFPLDQEIKLEALNLRGCRSLEALDKVRLFGAATANVMFHIQDLDLSSVKRINPVILADALRMVRRLESLSLRYVATDIMIRALADSEATKTTMRLVDVSFSDDLKDEACEALVHSANKLERLNLRACTSISPALYNSIPVWLQHRRSGGGAYPSSLTELRALDGHQHQRKGDVMFQFSGEVKR